MGLQLWTDDLLCAAVRLMTQIVGPMKNATIYTKLSNNIASTATTKRALFWPVGSPKAKRQSQNYDSDLASPDSRIPCEELMAFLRHLGFQARLSLGF